MVAEPMVAEPMVAEPMVAEPVAKPFTMDPPIPPPPPPPPVEAPPVPMPPPPQQPSMPLPMPPVPTAEADPGQFRQPDPSAPFVAVLLTPGGDGEAEESPAPVVALDMRPRVLGVQCKNDHFNDPSLRYCSVCGISHGAADACPARGPPAAAGRAPARRRQYVPARRRLRGGPRAAAGPGGCRRNGPSAADHGRRRRRLTPPCSGRAGRLGRARGRPWVSERHLRPARPGIRSGISWSPTSRSLSDLEHR